MTWTQTKRYQWIADRARAGEPVAISTDRPDIGRIIDFLAQIDGRGLSLQDDSSAGLLWVVRREDCR